MKENKRHLPAILAVLAVLILASLACSFSNVDLSSGSARVTVELHENEINDLIAHSDNSVDEEDLVLKEITGVELHDGYMRVNGVYDTASGTEAEGSYDVVLRAESGELKAQITGVDIEGLELESERIQHLNTEVAEALARSAKESHGEVEFETVEISDSALTIVVNTNWKEQ